MAITAILDKLLATPVYIQSTELVQQEYVIFTEIKIYYCWQWGWQNTCLNPESQIHFGEMEHHAIYNYKSLSPLASAALWFN